MNTVLKIILVDKNTGRSAILRRTLQDKGLLMQHKNINEDEAYQSLRKMAMNKNKRIVDVAESVISAFELLE